METSNTFQMLDSSDSQLNNENQSNMERSPSDNSLRYERHFLESFQNVFTEMPNHLKEVLRSEPQIDPRIIHSVPRSPKIRTPTTPKRSQRSTSSFTGSFRQTQKDKRITRGSKTRPLPPWMKDPKGEEMSRIKGILNKITPEKFDMLCKELEQAIANTTNEQVFTEAIALIVSKAVQEPNFSSMYADMCFRLSSIEIEINGGKKSFRRVLLNTCQEGFEKSFHHEDLSHLSPEEREAIERAERKMKRGNVKFVGELFKKSLLPEKIVHVCIKALFDDIYRHQSNDALLERYIEMLCNLLETVGSTIDANPKAREYTNTYFQRLASLTRGPNITSRLKFMILVRLLTKVTQQKGCRRIAQTQLGATT